MKPLTLRWVISEEYEGSTIKDFLLKTKGISRRSLTAIKLKGGSIWLNTNPVTVRQLLKKDDVLEVQFPHEEPSDQIIAEDLPLDIIYEDEHILVINKQPHMAAIPSREHKSGTLANAVLHYYNQKGFYYTIHIVNRLDRDTSGLLIIAKHSYAHHLFSIEQQAGHIKRRYEAIVHGCVEEDAGIIDLPIGRKNTSIIEREVRSDGQKAITRFKVIRRFNNKTWLSLQLETGRTHQIRVHMANKGHPLIGDDLYGGKTDEMSRQALHSKELKFYHPIIEKTMNLETELPIDFKKIIFD